MHARITTKLSRSVTADIVYETWPEYAFGHARSMRYPFSSRLEIYREPETPPEESPVLLLSNVATMIVLIFLQDASANSAPVPYADAVRREMPLLHQYCCAALVALSGLLTTIP